MFEYFYISGDEKPANRVMSDVDDEHLYLTTSFELNLAQTSLFYFCPRQLIENIKRL